MDQPAILGHLPEPFIHLGAAAVAAEVKRQDGETVRLELPGQRIQPRSISPAQADGIESTPAFRPRDARSNPSEFYLIHGAETHPVKRFVLRPAHARPQDPREATPSVGQQPAEFGAHDRSSP